MTAVHTATIALNVTAITGSIRVLFVAQVNHLPSPPRLPGPHPPPIQHFVDPIAPTLNLPTPVNPERLKHLLAGYEPSIADFLFHGFKNGFSIHFEGIHFSSDSNNLTSATENPSVVDAKIAKELEAHRLAGPFHNPPLTPFRISPLGVVPKKNFGEFRLIHHLSFPKGSSVNDGIPLEHSRVCYATIGDAINHIKAVGTGAYLAKTDIKSAFRILPINPIDYGLLGMKWKNKYYYDRCMPMGCSSSCKTFETFSSALEWIARTKFKIQHVLHLLDDFLFIAPSERLCQQQLNNSVRTWEFP